MRHRMGYAAVVVVVVTAAVLTAVAIRDRDGTGTPSDPPSARPAASATAPLARGSASTPSPSQPAVLSDGFGFVVVNRTATVRSEVSDTVLMSFTPVGRSFTSLSRTVSPDGRLIAYWDPVDGGAVLHVRDAAGTNARAVLTAGPGMSGNAFTWSSDSGGLVVALDNGCQEICGGPFVAELWTVDLGAGVTEKVASGKIWLPVEWDRAAMLVSAGVTGPGGYLTAYDVIDLSQRPHPVRSTEFRPTIFGRLKASGDARYVLLSTVIEGGPSSVGWWPMAEPAKRSTVEFDGQSAEWRPGTDEIWWVGGLEPAGCRIELCVGTQLSSINVTTGARSVVLRGRFGSLLEGFRADGTAAITSASGTVRTELTVVDLATGRTVAVTIGGFLEGAVRLR